MSGSRTPSRFAGRGAIVACLVLGMTGIGATPMPTSAPAALCIPILLPCSSPSPSPSPTQNPLLPLPNPLGGTGSDATPPAEAPAQPDTGAPVFTQPAAQLGGSSISFSGLQSVSAVTVPLADGSRIPVLKLVADDIVIDGFMLDVRKAAGPALVSTADRMELRGHVEVYVDSLTATLPGGAGITLGAATPPPGDELPPKLLRVNLGLVGVTADSIVFAASHQAMK